MNPTYTIVGLLAVIILEALALRAMIYLVYRATKNYVELSDRVDTVMSIARQVTEAKAKAAARQPDNLDLN